MKRPKKCEIKALAPILEKGSPRPGPCLAALLMWCAGELSWGELAEIFQGYGDFPMDPRVLSLSREEKVKILRTTLFDGLCYRVEINVSEVKSISKGYGYLGCIEWIEEEEVWEANGGRCMGPYCCKEDAMIALLDASDDNLFQVVLK